jgi:anti-sigma B factor antagonist
VTILEVEAQEHDGFVHVSLQGELDLSTVGKVNEELQRWEGSDSKVLMVDLSKLTFLDSTGLRCVVRADERAREEGRRLVVVKGPEAVQRVFEITRLSERLELVDDASSVQGR